MAVLLMSVDKLKERSFIDTNVDDKVLKLSMELCQNQIIEPILGTKLFDKITEGISAGSLELAYQNLLVRYIWPVLISGTENIAYKKILYRVTNDSIVKSSNANSTAIDISELRDLIRDNEVFTRQYVQKLQLYLNSNTATFPEYYQADSDDFPAEDGTSAQSFYYDMGDDYVTGPSSR
ncbi:MAG TPA: hypothetical protein PK122_03395 [Candidatus Paceibacterota bacterium]|nr:hypothetical protein [Candidatus Paceibacterota bacterium]